MNETETPEPATTESVASILPTVKANSTFNGGVLIILTFVVLKLADTLFIPIVVAIFLKLVLQPVSRFFQRLRMPPQVSALLIILLLVGGLGILGSIIATPATDWAQKIPETLPDIKAKLYFLSKPVAETQKTLSQAEDLTKAIGPKAPAVTLQGSSLVDRIFVGTKAVASSLFTIVLILFFLLSSGDTFLRRIVETLQEFKAKRQTVEIFKQIEQDISIYLMTITFMNFLVGLGTGVIMSLCNVEDPLLWAALAFILNYVPILGPFAAAATFAFVGMMGDGTLWNALTPAALYLVIHMIESSFITPHLLAKRFTLNPVLVILSLVFWSWMWGLVGAILAVPLLATAKIVFDRVERLKPLGHFIEG